MMKIKFLFLFLIISITGMAQDKIYLTDNSVVNVKISEITVSEIKYKKFDNPTGPDYIMPKSLVAMIVFENGTHEVMDVTKTNTKTEETSILLLPNYLTHSNLIGVNYFDLIYKNISLSYTRFLCDYHFNIGASASFGLTNSNYPYYNGNSFLNFDKDYFHGAFSFNYFPSGMKKVSYFTGLSIMAGMGAEYEYDYYGPYVLKNKSYYGVYVNNGIQFNLTGRFNMRTTMALGMVDRDMNGDFQTHAMFEVMAGIRL